MKKLLNTLFVTTQGTYLSRKGEGIQVTVEGEKKLHIPIHTLDGIICFGQVTCSAPMLGLCGERNVTVSLLSERGRFLARVQGPVSGNVLLRRQQYRLADHPEQCVEIARAVVVGKVANCRTVLMRGAREADHADAADALRSGADELKRLLDGVRQAPGLEELRGLEGTASRIYFGVFDHLIRRQKEDFVFRGRSRRPPLDNINALLSFAYTLLVHGVISALESVGLDPQVGYLHRDRPGRPSLALDIMEEFRPVLADRLVLSLINRCQIQAADFEISTSGAIMMKEKPRKKVLTAWQKRKADVVEHPFLEEKLAAGLLPYAQALLLARHLRGDIDGYPPYVWR